MSGARPGRRRPHGLDPLDPPETPPTGRHDPRREAVTGAERGAAYFKSQPEPVGIARREATPVAGNRTNPDTRSLHLAQKPVQANSSPLLGRVPTTGAVERGLDDLQRQRRQVVRPEHMPSTVTSARSRRGTVSVNHWVTGIAAGLPLPRSCDPVKRRSPPGQPMAPTMVSHPARTTPAPAVREATRTRFRLARSMERGRTGWRR